MIQPFGDGNGRMSRILMNVLLLKYAGHVSLFGGEADEKEEYLEIVRGGQKGFHNEDMEIEFEKQTSHLEFARYVLTKSRAELENMWHWAKGKGKAGAA